MQEDKASARKKWKKRCAQAEGATAGTLALS